MFYFVIMTILKTLDTISHGMIVRSKSVSQNQADAQAALQANTKQALVQVHSTKSGATLGQFTHATDLNRMIEQVRLVANGWIQHMNTNTSQVLSKESALGHNLSITYQMATGVLRTFKTVTFSANLTQKPQS